MVHCDLCLPGHTTPPHKDSWTAFGECCMTANSRTAGLEHLTDLLALCAQGLSILPTSTSTDFKVDSERVCPTTNPIQP